MLKAVSKSLPTILSLYFTPKDNRRLISMLPARGAVNARIPDYAFLLPVSRGQLRPDANASIQVYRLSAREKLKYGADGEKTKQQNYEIR